MGLTDTSRAAALLAIDAGNSKTDVAVLAADGRVIGAARGGGFRPPAVGMGAAVDSLAETVGRALAEAAAAAGAGAGAEAEVAAEVTGVRHVVACLANADFPVEERELATALSARRWGRTLTVHNDTFAILRAGLPAGAEQRGVAVVCGAGINCVGMTPDGRTARFPAIGRISGDWGGGWGLAEEALWYAARAEDGRGEPTELARTLPAHFHLPTMYALIEALHLKHIAPPRTHELTPVLFATAASGDPLARAIVDRLADEVVAMATVALDRLDLLAEPAPVLLGGSVLAAGHPDLDSRIRALLATRAPKATARTITARPVLGAALLGLDELGAADEVYRSVRAHYEG
ncbi:N-acetylglucosamine kinase [Streptomyces apocyni]|uniref:N-acetylglucosamine kinase n=1 Tax=Streptomyces apocyni TaxID=2654677 RepID=UPI001E5D1239|nr:BadF/BadG/BcrA/BcrD ATPase family protein [Streptomyces apocyni]